VKHDEDSPERLWRGILGGFHVHPDTSAGGTGTATGTAARVGVGHYCSRTSPHHTHIRAHPRQISPIPRPFQPKAGGHRHCPPSSTLSLAPNSPGELDASPPSSHSRGDPAAPQGRSRQRITRHLMPSPSRTPCHSLVAPPPSPSAPASRREGQTQEVGFCTANMDASHWHCPFRNGLSLPFLGLPRNAHSQICPFTVGGVPSVGCGPAPSPLP
jgi:hypothetical protein